MIVTLIQSDIVWADSAANRKVAEAALSASEKAELFIFPEMFTTGFATKPDGIAEAEGETVEWMKRMAARYDAAMAGSVAVKEVDGSYHNRFYFVKPDGSVTTYDKRHLFTYGGEDKQYTRGKERVVVEWGGMRFLLQICYDLRFPTFSRNRINADGRADYDAVIYVANWPDSRRRVWDVLLRARAIENQCYALGVNRVGSDEVCTYDGGTAVIDAYGRDVVKAHENRADSVTVNLDMNRLNAFRQKFPVLLDADN